MMPMHFPYGNSNTAGQHLYGAAVCPNFGVNYNQYFTSFYSNSNGLLPLPSTERNKCLTIPPLMSKELLNHSPSASFFMSPEAKKDQNSNDFLTFIKQKTKPISELNPFANEFSLVKSNTHSTNQIVTTDKEKSSAYRLIFDDLIEQSLQSIEAIKKASKAVPVNHVSIQCHQSIDQINRSTQTNDDNDQHSLLEKYSSRTVKLMNNLLENFKYLLLLSTKNDLHNQLKYISDIYDELRYLTLVINQIITSNKSSMKRDNLFSNMIKDLSIQSSPMILDIEERTRRLISSSISYSSTPSFSSRQIDPITMGRSKMCLLCQKSVDDSNDVMHKLCRLLSSPPDASIDT